jgi:hypothetical protein
MRLKKTEIISVIRAPKDILLLSHVLTDTLSLNALLECATYLRQHRLAQAPYLEQIQLHSAVSGQHRIHTADIGLYWIQRLLENPSYTSDQVVAAFIKSVADSSAATDYLTLYVGKHLVDSGNVSTVINVDTIKSLSDIPYISSKVSLDSRSQRYDASQVFDLIDFIQEKPLKSPAAVTDTLTHRMIFRQTPGDQASLSDTGRLLIQGYVTSPYYFADDYIGDSRHFT